MSVTTGTPYNGRCLCGGVKFSAVPVREAFTVCHCSMCRRWTGGPLFAVDCGTDVAFENEPLIGVVQSSEWAERGYCKACGSALFYRLQGDGSHQMALGAFDGADAFEFEMQVFIDAKPECYTFANRTRELTGQQVIDYFVNAAGAETPPGDEKAL